MKCSVTEPGEAVQKPIISSGERSSSGASVIYYQVKD